MNRVKLNRSLFAAAAVVLVLSLSVGTARAYFTTYVTAKGGRTITLENKTEIQERIEEFDKIISVTNTGEQPCYTRIRVIAGSQYELTFIDTANWYQDGDYWVYEKILAPGETTPEAIRVHISYPEGQDVDFNVVVIEESVPVSVDETGRSYADWDAKTEQVEEE